MAPSLLTDDLTEMSILGSFMFLLNEMRDLYRGKREPKESDEKYTPEAMKDLFSPIMDFPMTVDTIQSVVVKARDVLVPLQGEKRYQAHLDMLDYMTTQETSGAYEKARSLVFMNYPDDKQASGHELVYSLVLDHSKKRVTVVFRGSVTSEDWAANLTVQQEIIDNPILGADPSEIRMHQGFYDYIFEPIHTEEGDVESEQPASKTCFDVIMAQVQDVLKEHPNYDVYTTGVSLGGALTNVFAFFAAAHPSLNRPGHPVKCYSFASPKVGAISFRKAVQDLEKNGRLMLCRVANDNDPVVPLPRRCCAIYPMCGLEYIVMCSLCCLQWATYRHVGLGLQLPQSEKEHARFVHTRIETNRIRMLCSDWAKLWGRTILLTLHFIHIIFTCTNPMGYRDNHGYPEYWIRVNQQLPYLKSLEDEGGNKLTLEELYREFLNDDRTIVKTRFM